MATAFATDYASFVEPVVGPFEGTVQTRALENGNDAPLGQGFVTGGSTGPGPFEGTLAFAKPKQKYGALMLYTTTQEGAPVGHTREVTVVRVRFS